MCKRGAHQLATNTRPSRELLSGHPFISPAMDRARDERISGESNQSSAHCDAKSQMGTVGDDVAGFMKCRRMQFRLPDVRVYRGGPGAWPDFC